MTWTTVNDLSGQWKERSFPIDTDANRWHRTDRTRAEHLLGVISYFLSQGWPEKFYDHFLRGVEPPFGWDGPQHVLQNTRPAKYYSYFSSAILHGWYYTGIEEIEEYLAPIPITAMEEKAILRKK